MLRPTERRHPAHGVCMDFGMPIVHVTVCAERRERWIADPEVHSQLRGIWEEATAWLVGRYVLMPDHLHLLALGNTTSITLDGWVRYWKSQFSKAHGIGTHEWQREHWDTRMRTARQVRDKWFYIQQNPVRWGLVERSEDWALQGVVHPWPLP